jgi:hypothetical protein
VLEVKELPGIRRKSSDQLNLTEVPCVRKKMFLDQGSIPEQT